MGELVTKRYPTQLFLDLADHTYVECGTGGQGWSCWGGKTGGTELRRGVGSTRRADQIAGANERGGITCYLINGVCHQAANRILLPAQITVRGARGYEVSEALFGTYGRPGGIFGLCKAPFDQHAGTTGDLPACVAPASPASRRTARARKPRGRAATAAASERRYLRGVLSIYRQARAPLANAARANVREQPGSRGLSRRAVHAPGGLQAGLTRRSDARPAASPDPPIHRAVAPEDRGMVREARDEGGGVRQGVRQ